MMVDGLTCRQTTGVRTAVAWRAGALDAVGQRAARGAVAARARRARLLRHGAVGRTAWRACRTYPYPHVTIWHVARQSVSCVHPEMLAMLIASHSLVILRFTFLIRNIQ
jgi:hypothetical protein